MAEPGAYPLPTIVVAAFNRLAPLLRLLGGLESAQYPDSPVQLIISIDRSPTPDVVDAAQAFSWSHGPKEVLLQPQRLGLKAHLIACGDLSQEYSAVIVLEDDLMVSPHFYSYACQSLAFYAEEPQIAGLSLYHYEVAESSQLPFRPLADGSDVYFMQWPSSWGQAWTADQWRSFRSWLDMETKPERFWPEFVAAWEPQSWKRLFLAYLRATDRYFVYPRTGLSSHYGEAGEHSVQRGAQQSTLQSLARAWRFQPLAASHAVYDAWFELQPDRLAQLVPELADKDFSVDLYGQKEAAALAGDWVLSSRGGGSAAPQFSWSCDLLPLVQNVIQNQRGEGIALVPRAEIPPQQLSRAAYLARLSGWHRLQAVGGARQHLSLSVVLPWGNKAEAVQRTLDGILDQVDLAVEVVLVRPGAWQVEADPRIRLVDWPAGQSYWQALELGCRTATGDLLFWVHPGARLGASLLSAGKAILEQYQQVDWLLLRPDEMVNLAAQRWTRDRLGRTSPLMLQAQLGPGVHFWRRSLLLKMQGHWQDEAQLWAQLAAEALPFSTPLVGATVDVSSVPWSQVVQVEALRRLRADRSWPGFWLSQMLRPFFLTNSALRWAHMQMEHYPPVICKAGAQWEMKRF